MSEWKQGAAERRDERATKDEPVQRVGNTRKNTKKWCKGKVGREHVLVIEISNRWGSYKPCQPTGWWSCNHHEVCSVCHKVLRWTLPLEECPTINPTRPQEANHASTSTGP